MNKKDMINNKINSTFIFVLLSIYVLSGCSIFGQNETMSLTKTSLPVTASQTILSTSTRPIPKEATPTGTSEIGYAPPGAGGQLILTAATPYPDLSAIATDDNIDSGRGQLSPYPASDGLRLTITPQFDDPYPIVTPIPATGAALTSNEIYYATATALAYPGPALSDPQAALTEPVMVSTTFPTPFPGVTPTLVRIRFTPTNPKDFTLVAGFPQLIVLYADWSPESNSMAPVINGLESRFSTQVNFVYLDLEDPANSMLNVLGENQVPPILFLLDGQGNILKHWRGLVEPAELEQALQLAS